MLGGSSEQSGPGMWSQCISLVFGTLENTDSSGKNGRRGELVNALLRKGKPGDLLEKLRLWMLLPRLMKR